MKNSANHLIIILRALDSIFILNYIKFHSLNGSRKQLRRANKLFDIEISENHTDKNTFNFNFKKFLFKKNVISINLVVILIYRDCSLFFANFAHQNMP